MRKLLASVLCAAAVGACATPSAFAPAAPNGQASGFWDSRIEADRYRVSYRGGSGAPPALVRDYALLHAADVTVAAGYDWFRIVGRFGEAQAGSSSSLSIGGGGTSFGRRSAVGLGGGVSFPLSGGPQLTESLEIVLGRGTKPDAPDAYGARDLQASLRPRLPV